MKQKARKLLSILLIVLSMASIIPIPAALAEVSDIKFDNLSSPYSGSPIALNAITENSSYIFTYWYVCLDSTNDYKAEDPPTDVGSYSVKVHYESATASGDKYAILTITKANVNYSIDETQDIKVGRGLLDVVIPVAGIGVAGEIVGGKLVWYTDKSCNTIASDSTLIEIVELKKKIPLYWRFTPDSGNYNIAEGETTITIVGTQPLKFTDTGDIYKAYSDEFTNTATHVGGSETKGDITYSSNNTSVASINEKTGEVKVVGIGEAIITATAKRVIGAWAEDTANYKLTASKKTPDSSHLSFTLPGNGAVTYDGVPHPVTVKARSDIEGLITVRTVKYTNIIPGSVKTDVAPIDAGTYDVEVEVTGSEYYNNATISLNKFTINKKAVEGIKQEVRIKANESYIYKYGLSMLIPSEVNGNQIEEYYNIRVYGNTGIIDGNVEIINNEIIVPIRDTAKASDYINITISYISKNYDISDAVIRVNVVNKTLLKMNGGTVISRAYNGEKVEFDDSDLTFTDVIHGVTIPDHLKPELDLIWPNGSEPQNVGHYELKVEIKNNSNYEIEKAHIIPFEITEAEILVKADDKNATVDSTIPVFTYTVVHGLVKPDTWQTVIASEPTIECLTANMAVAGEYPITISGGFLNNEAGANYKFKYENGTLTVSNKSTQASSSGDKSSGSVVVPTVVETPLDETPENAEESEAPIIPFTDVKEDDWYYADVVFAYKRELMNGTEEDKFSPAMDLTRATIVTVLYRYAGSPSVSDLNNPFFDVPADKWYTNAIIWAAANNIVQGYGDGIFAPDNKIRRQELAAILYRYANETGISLAEVREYQVFLDEKSIADYAKEAIEVLFKAGIVSGKPGNLFDPGGYATRAEVGVMLHRFILSVEKAQGADDVENAEDAESAESAESAENAGNEEAIDKAESTKE